MLFVTVATKQALWARTWKGTCAEPYKYFVVLGWCAEAAGNNIFLMKGTVGAFTWAEFNISKDLELDLSGL